MSDLLHAFVLPQLGVRGAAVRLEAGYRQVLSHQPYVASVGRWLGEALAAASLLVSVSVLTAFWVTVLSPSGPVGPLAGIGLRTGLPLAALAAASADALPWAGEAFRQSLLASYLPALALESILAARFVSRARSFRALHGAESVPQDSPQAV